MVEYLGLSLPLSSPPRLQTESHAYLFPQGPGGQAKLYAAVPLTNTSIYRCPSNCPRRMKLYWARCSCCQGSSTSLESSPAPSCCTARANSCTASGLLSTLVWPPSTPLSCSLGEMKLAGLWFPRPFAQSMCASRHRIPRRVLLPGLTHGVRHKCSF